MISANIKNELGAYKVLMRDQIAEQMFQSPETVAHLKTYFTEAQANTEVALPAFQLSEVVQGFQAQLTRKGDAAMRGHKTTMRRCKINVGIDADAIVGEWEGFLYNEKLKRTDMPITRYIMERVLLKVQEEREEEIAYKGVYVAPTLGTPSTAAAAVDGLGRMIALGITGGTIAPFVQGAVTAANIFEYVEQFLVNIPSKFRYKKLKLFMSHDNLLNYQRDKRNTYNYKIELSELIKVDFSSIEVIGLASMAGRNRIFATVPGNLVRLLHKNYGADNLELRDDSPYVVDVVADWHECYGIADHRYFWCNDVA